MLFSLMDGAHRLQWWGAIGLLSSSCCALQLLLNALNFGCAGFNNILGPLRPTLCALTLCVQSAVWYTALNAPVPQLAYVAPCTALAVGLTLLPELTYFWVSRAVKAKAHTGLTTGVQSCLALAVEGMGCVSCTKKVAEVLDSFPEVLSREIIFEEKRVRATLSLGVEEARELLLPRLLASVAEAGFQAELAELSVPTGEKLSESPDALSASEGSPQASCCEAGLLSGAGVAGLPLSIAAAWLQFVLFYYFIVASYCCYLLLFCLYYFHICCCVIFICCCVIFIVLLLVIVLLFAVALFILFSF
ncbi:unnamed protein product [Polarella glacialis]|uniref:HMA domain-containing protein n=1 Tax=Polarella glacialis TaxID=89957 RepID=A0A813J302_POLGL|nr:unnamed protein product [Polarella glacialis]CAE8672011.1 unnamed protein product [Polarella glacialis]